MEGGSLRDINELLLNGYFKTARGKSPSGAPPLPPKPSAYLYTPQYEPRRERSRSRGPRRSPPPRPTVEDEAASLAREHLSDLPDYDPPLRGLIEQNPIILEAEVTDAEAARLHEIPAAKDKVDDNPERRFVFIPRSDTGSSNSEDDAERSRRERRKRDSGKSFQKEIPIRETKKEAPPIERRRTSRQDLPALETKVPREIPPQFRRSASAFVSTPKDTKNIPRTPTAEYFLSPEVMRGNHTFTPSQSAPRYYPNDNFGGRANEKRNSGSFSGSRPTTPSSEKRNSGNFESGRRSRRTSNEKLTRPQHLPEELGRKPDRYSDRNSTRSSRSSHSNRRHCSSSDDEPDSDSDRQRRRRHRSNKLHPEDERHIRSSSRASNALRPGKPISRYTSPLPSPKVSPSQIPTGETVERSGTFPMTRRTSERPPSPRDLRDKLNPFDTNAPRPGSRQSTTVPIPIPMPMSKSQDSTASLPVPIPSRIDVHSPGETRRPAVSPYEDGSSSARPAEKATWQPPKFQPPSNPTHLDKPVGYYRRYSEEIGKGSVTPLPTCPRKSFVRGRSDWLTLPQCQGFDICPSCYDSTMAPTEFRNMFVPAPFRSPDTEVLCDFGSSPWYRIAWLLTLKEKRRDLNLFYGLANVAKNIEPCAGGHQTMRQWYSILDPKTLRPIPNFDVCTNCVRSIEVLLPSIRGVFVRTDAHLISPNPRICDLRFDSKRFVQYFDALETTSDKASYNLNQPIDTRNLAALVRNFSLVEECQKDVDLRDTRWHIITQLPEFTVCEECFDEVVWPYLSSSSSSSSSTTQNSPFPQSANFRAKAIPLMFNKTPQRLPKGSCQLYSEKTRDVFKKAVEGDDYKFLVAQVRQRRLVENAVKANVAEVRRNMMMGMVDQASGKREIDRIMQEWRGKWE